MAAQTKKTAAAKASAKKAPAKKAPVKKAAASKAVAAKSPAKTAAKKSPAKKPAAIKAPAKKTTAAAASAEQLVTSAPAKKAPVKKAPAKKAPAKSSANTAAKSTLTTSQVKEFTKLISEELTRVRREYDESIRILDELKNAGQDSSGDDPADAGAKTFEREQEMSIANNRLDLITQMERATVRIKEGTYGRCESCGEMIPVARLQAFPQATLCVACKAREERR